MNKSTPCLLGLILLIGVSASGFAQTNYDTSPPAQTGAQVYGSYFGADLDSIGLYNGNLQIMIPLFALPGRELPYGLSINYNSQKWEADDCSGFLCGRYSGGWQKANVFGSTPSFFAEYLNCEAVYPYRPRYVLNIFWIDGSGAKHRYKAEDWGTGSCGSPNAPGWDNRTIASVDSDGTVFSTGNYMSYGSAAARIDFKNGNKLYFRDHSATSPSYDLVTPNGNYLVKSTSASGLPTQDTLGRTASYSCSSCTSSTPQETYTLTDANGQSQSYTLNWAVVNNLYDPWWGDTADWIYVRRLSSVVLPNSKSYSFEYDHPQGFMTKMTLPSGAYVKYVYTTGNDYDHMPEYDQVIERRVSVDGTSSTEKVWTYSGYAGGGTSFSSRTVTVTAPEGDKVVHVFSVYGTESETEWRTSSNVALKKVTSSWSQPSVESNGQPNTPRVNTVSTYLPPFITWLNSAPHSVTEITYDSNLNVTQEKTYQADDSFVTLSVQKDFTYTTISGSFVRVATETLSAIDPTTGSVAVQGKKEFFYDDYSVTDRGSSVPNHTHNTSSSSRGNLTKVRAYKDASNYIETQTKYDNVGNVVEAIDGLSHSTTIDFTDNFTDSTNRNSFAFPKSVTNGLNHAATSKYDYNTGLMKEVINVRSETTETEYDLMGRVTSVTEPNGKETTFSYDDTNRITTKEVTVDSSGNKGHVETFFDKLYRTIKTVTNDPEGAITVETEYDGDGRVKKVSNPYRSGDTVVWTQSAYDALSRPTTLTAPDNSTVSYAYAYNKTTTTDQAGNQRRYTFNILGQLVSVEEPNPTLDTPVTTTYVYYGFGPLYQSNQSGQTRTWVYNWLGLITSQTLPESGTTGFEYYAGSGLLHRKTDARGVETELTYDDIDRVEERSYSDGTPTVTYSYDQSSQTGLRTAMSDALGSVTYTYDTMDRLTQESRSLTGVSGTFSTSYVYNVKGDVTQMTYPSGRVVNFAYSTSGGCCNSRLASVADGTTSTTLLDSLTFNAPGSLLTQTLNPGSNAISQTFTYNNRLQITQIQAAKGSTSIMDFSYDYGTSSTNTGRVLKKTDAIQPEHSASYVYDSIYRLSQVAGVDGSWATNWVFDVWGNRTSQTPSGVATSKVGSQTLGYSSNKNNAFTYDYAGNTTNDTVHNYDFNAENQQTSMDGGAATYAYDGEGRRMKKGTSSETTYTFYGPGGILCEFSTTNTGATAASANDKTLYRTSERTGTANLIFTLAGLVIENNRTLPYGEAWLADVALTNDRKFTTYEREQESGLDYAINRRYASFGGRFTSPDLADPVFEVPSTLNRYVYGANDPINLVDPDGRLGISISFGRGSIVFGRGPLININIVGILVPVIAIFGGNNLQSTVVRPDKNWEKNRIQELLLWLEAIKKQVNRPGDPYKLVVVKDCYVRGGSRALGDFGLAAREVRMRRYTVVDINNKPVYGTTVREINHVYGDNELEVGNATFSTGITATFEDYITSTRVLRQDQVFLWGNKKLLIQEGGLTGRIVGHNEIYSDRNIVVINGDANAIFVTMPPKPRYCD